MLNISYKIKIQQIHHFQLPTSLCRKIESSDMMMLHFLVALVMASTVMSFAPKFGLASKSNSG